MPVDTVVLAATEAGKSASPMAKTAARNSFFNFSSLPFALVAHRRSERFGRV
jgi:hypothetical protein